MSENQKFIAYFRVSTDKQGKSGLGLAAQKKSVAQFVFNASQILESYTEVESGKKQNRPELQKELLKAKSLGATLLIAKLDRLARNVAFIANLLESGVEVVAVDMPQANKFMLHVMAAVAEQEATAISERTKAALQIAKARGVKLGWANPRRKDEQMKSSAKGLSARKAKCRYFCSQNLSDVCEAACAGILRSQRYGGCIKYSGRSICTGWHLVYVCVFRSIRPVIPITSAHLFRAIRPPEVRCV